MGRAVCPQNDTPSMSFANPNPLIHPARAPSSRSRLRTPSFTRRIVKVLEARVVLVAK